MFYHDFSSVSSVVQSCLALWNPMYQRTRLTCPSPTPRTYSNSCPWSQWCHPTISSSVVPLFSHFQSFPASGSSQMSQFLASSGQSIGVSASTSVLPVNTQDWSPLGWIGGSPCSPRDSQESSLTLQFKTINSFVLNFLVAQLSYLYMTTGKHSFDYRDFCLQSGISAF